MSVFVPTAKLLRISNLGTNSYAASLYLIGKKVCEKHSLEAVLQHSTFLLF